MLTHAQIWEAIDRLAAAYNMTPSGLARRAGLDPTTFNPSKRTTPQGKLRWPSTESVSKVLKATGATMGEFVALIGDQVGGVPQARIPIIGYAQAGAEGYFDDAGYPSGEGWDEVLFPNIKESHVFALEVSGDSMAPLYRDGDLIIVAPGAPLRRGDRIVARTKGGEVMAKEIGRQTATRIELRSLNPSYEDRILEPEEIAWMHRIIWASQ